MGLTVQLSGYSPITSILITMKLYDLALLELYLYVPRLNGECVYNPLSLPKSKNDDIVAAVLARELLETKGDCTAYLGVLME